MAHTPGTLTPDEAKGIIAELDQLEATNADLIAALEYVGAHCSTPDRAFLRTYCATAIAKAQSDTVTHFHSSDHRFCNSTPKPRHFVLDPNEVTCKVCKALAKADPAAPK